jgi:hypothetical protein
VKNRKIPQQIIPLVLLFGAGIGALLISRWILVPKTFGQYGHYRAAAVEEVAALPQSYAGYQTCLDCHQDIYDLKQGSNHKGLACETCHGPCKSHIDDPEKFTPPAPRDRKYCTLCHGYNPSRPSGFPQILSENHNPGKACMSCHNPHAPVLPHPPEECSACHREIANRKMVSHHATVPCTTCHTVPPDHWQNPASVLATKPTNRELCGKCHAKGADSPAEIPRIDLETHNKRYMCWDCHYPHFPEVGS